MFLPKIVTQSPIFFSHCPEFWKFFTQRPLIGWNLRKMVPKCPLFLWLLSLKDPLYFALQTHVCFRGILLPQTQSEARKFCILETESCNLVNTFRCKFNKGAENKISVLQDQPTQLCIMDEFHWRAGMIYRLLSLLRGYILQPPSINLHTWLSKRMPAAYLRMCEQKHFKCKVQCPARWRAQENFEI